VRSKATVVLGFGALLAFWPSSQAQAEAAPDIWQRICEPAAKDAWQLHVSWLSELTTGEGQEPGQRTQIPARVRFANAQRLLDARKDLLEKHEQLQVDLAQTHLATSDYAKAFSLLEPLALKFPSGPLSESVWIAMASSLSYLDRPVDEYRAHAEHLERETFPHLKTTASLNKAESRMRAGDAAGAIAEYRDALSLEQSIGGQGLTHQLLVWGLTVAIDRGGDLAEARTAASLALAVDPNMRTITSERGVYFVPAYERNWYRALGLIAMANRAGDSARGPGQGAQGRGAQGQGAATARLWLLGARDLFGDYLRRTHDRDPYLERARAHYRQLSLQLSPRDAVDVPKPGSLQKNHFDPLRSMDSFED
jgi:tetratricopeptide (TPR) repeat protein